MERKTKLSNNSKNKCNAEKREGTRKFSLFRSSLALPMQLCGIKTLTKMFSVLEILHRHTPKLYGSKYVCLWEQSQTLIYSYTIFISLRSKQKLDWLSIIRRLDILTEIKIIFYVSMRINIKIRCSFGSCLYVNWLLWLDGLFSEILLPKVYENKKPISWVLIIL